MSKYLQFSVIILLSCVNTVFAQQNGIRIIYNANSGDSQLQESEKVYLYSGAVTSGQEGQWEWIVGSANLDDGIGEMTPIGNNRWSICIDPGSYYSSGAAGEMPEGVKILAINLYFRNADGTAFGYNKSGKPVVIDLSSDTPVSDFAGVTVSTCKLGIKNDPEKNQVLNNYPNPLKAFTVITYNLTEYTSKVNIKIYDMLGQQIRAFNEENHRPGVYKLTWNGDDTNGIPLKNGVYFYSLEINGSVIRTNKILISR